MTNATNTCAVRFVYKQQPMSHQTHQSTQLFRSIGSYTNELAHHTSSSTIYHKKHFGSGTSFNSIQFNSKVIVSHNLNFYINDTRVNFIYHKFLSFCAYKIPFLSFWQPLYKIQPNYLHYYSHERHAFMIKPIQPF